MPTKLSRFCDGIMEAAWLAAVILIPIFFNVYSSRIFEPDKITLLRSLALLILLAWIVKLVEQGGFRWDRIDPGESRLRAFLKIPLIIPALATAVLYLLATIFSITPSVSFWGSYQRLQGTYTTLSYLVIFAAIAGNLRRRSQVERLVTVIILTSLPVTFYGVLQKYKIDPVPWGGDTSIRIAANMGNSIFVAAYLIMVFPLTVGRIVEVFKSILNDEGRVILPVIRATIYIFIAALQVIALYMSGSRGPALGWMASSFFLFLLLSLYWQKRWLTVTTLGLAAALAVFLLVFNIPGGPLENLRKSPAIGRFGLLLNAESNSALVRKYIWEGAAKLVGIHQPLEFPDGGKDRFNFLRPIIGYGPESMYVAYNPFYVPDLAIVERRNASPDRSHNETWDSLVITGVAGILVYLAVFLSVIYYGLRWVGLIPSRSQRWLFFSFILAGGAVGAIGLSIWRGVEYFGVGMPFGMLIGLLVYITEVALTGKYDSPHTPGEAARFLLLIVLLAGIIAHFVEINFGIAIAATRTYFWVFSALLLCVGYILPLHNEYELSPELAVQPVNPDSSESLKKDRSSGSKKRRGRDSGRTSTGVPGDLRLDMVASLVTSIVMVTLAYDYVSNPKGAKSLFEIITISLTQLPNRNFAFSLGVLVLVFFVWILTAIVLSAESKPFTRVSTWLRSFGLTVLISGGISLVYWLWHAGLQASIARSTANDISQVLQTVGRYENLLTLYYVFILLLLLSLGYFLQEYTTAKIKIFSLVGVLTAGAGLIIVLLFAAYTNLRVIQADIAFKLAEPFSRAGQWPVAIAIYDRANGLAPKEDYYYLFLGRAYLEQAKSISDANDRERLIQQAADDLMKAQSINPLNTDHTANLARLYSLWSTYTSDPADKAKKAETSDYYFSRAVTLSPNSARLWDEWALLYLNLLGDPGSALERLEHAQSIDPKYHWTYALLAEYHVDNSRNLSDADQKREELQAAADYYRKAMELPTPGEPAARFNYSLGLANIQAQLGDFAGAIDTYLQALELAPSGTETWRIEEALGNLYAKTGDYPSALIHYQNALQMAPDDQKDRLQNNIDTIS